MDTLTIIVNGELAYEYDKATELSEQQLTFLDKMDEDMARGIKIRGELISTPDRQQRATFIAMNLLKALMQQDEAKIMVSCAYLCSRFPTLTEVQASDQDDGVAIELAE